MLTFAQSQLQTYLVESEELRLTIQKMPCLNKLLAKTNSRNLLPAVKEEFIKTGKPGYEFLIEKLDNPRLTDYQVVNVLQILLTMRYLGEPSQVIERLLDFTQDRRIRVRSYACCAAIALLLQSESCGTPSYQLNKEELKALVSKARSLGLEPGSTSFVINFIQGNQE